MTEQEWLTSTDPGAMLRYLTGEYVRGGLGTDPHQPVSARKLWLFVAGVERLWWGETASPGDRKEIEKLEAVADGKLGEGHLSRVGFSYTMPGSADAAAREAVRVHDSRGDPPRWAALLREIVGNPWRPHARWNGGAPIANGWTAIPDDWLAPQVLSVARAAYDLREWDRLPVLADALSDGGCEDITILDHLRGPGPHVRGCWALDLLLGLG